MKHLLLLLLAAALFGLAAAPNAPTSLSGTVRDAMSKQALPSALIRVFQKEKWVTSVVTDSMGRFSIKLEHGNYALECSATGYATLRYPSIMTLENQTRTLNIRLNKASMGLDESVVKDYQDPNDEPTEEMAASPTEGVIYDTIIAFSPETYEEKVSIVPRSAPTVTEAPAPVEKGEVAVRSTSFKSDKALSAKPMAAPAEYKATTVSKSAKPGSAPGKSRGEGTGMAIKDVAGAGEPSSRPAPMPDAKIEDRRMATKSAPMKKAKIADKEAAEALREEDDKAPATAGPTEVPSPRAGLLTAGEWNDLHNWNRHWLDLLADGEIDSYQKMYEFYPKNRYTVMLGNEQEVPLADVPVILKSGSETIWETRTDNTGKAELWAGLFSPAYKPEGELRVFATIGGLVQNLGIPKIAKEGINRYRIAAACDAPKSVDIVWAVDATGSMGDEIEYLKTELLDVIGRSKARDRELSFRMGTTFYRDQGDEYITRSSGLSYDISKTVEFIRQQHAGGGGDYPEAVHSALEEAIFNQKWSERAIARICFLVLDASPHQSPEVLESLHRGIREAARRGIRIVPVAASGIQKDTEFLMKFFGLATNGTYVFLTDHSGVGGKHLEPTTDEYKVENLNDLLVRLIGEYTSIESCEGKLAIRFEQDEQQQGQNWQAFYYPNPASTQFILELPFEVQSVTLYDAEGKSARKLERPQAGANTIAVNDLSEGFYTIRIQKDGRMQSGKILVVKGL